VNTSNPHFSVASSVWWQSVNFRGLLRNYHSLPKISPVHTKKLVAKKPDVAICDGGYKESNLQTVRRSLFQRIPTKEQAPMKDGKLESDSEGDSALSL
jgi:hypothetical protein